MEEATVKNIVNFLKGQKTVQLDSEEPRKRSDWYYFDLPEDSEYIYFQQSVLADGIGTLRSVDVEFGPKEWVSDDDWILNDLGILDNLLEVKGIKVFQQGLFKGKFAKWILDPEYRMVSKKDWRESTKWLESNNTGPIVEADWELPVKTMKDFIRFFRSEPNWVPVITVPTGTVSIEGAPNFTYPKYKNDLLNKLSDSFSWNWNPRDVTKDLWRLWRDMRLNESYRLIKSFEDLPD